jgi:hypothetical protein
LPYNPVCTLVIGVTGEYFAKEKIKRSSKESYDMDLAKKLWDVSEKYLKNDL